MLFDEIHIGIGFATREELEVLITNGVITEDHIAQRKQYDEYYITPVVRMVDLSIEQLSGIAHNYTVSMFNGNDLEITDR